MDNLLLLCDSYKFSHFKQYPRGTSFIYSYFESRGGRFPYTVFFGLQYVLKKYLEGVVITEEKIQEAKENHRGRLPIRIKAVPEGTVVSVKNVLFTIENTDPQTPWLTSLMETLLVQVWYPMTVATNSRVQKQIIHHYLSMTHDSLSSLPFKLHDFGFRGATSVEGAALGGAAHLVNFQSTDTMVAIPLLRDYYHEPMAGISVPASEHSTMTSWGKDGELDAFRNMLQQFPDGIVAVVSDSYDIFKSIKKLWGNELKSEVLARGKRGGVLAIRPDSGDPPKVVLKCLELLGEAYGTTENRKGYKMLPDYLRLIQGDGISYKTIGDILDNLARHGWSAENVVFGSGGALLQKVDRDTQKCAFKCSSAVINGKRRDVFKEPITDKGKKSKRGRLQLHKIDGDWITVESCEGESDKDHLELVFENGSLLRDQDLADIRKRAEVTTSKASDILAFLENDSLV